MKGKTYYFENKGASRHIRHRWRAIGVNPHCQLLGRQNDSVAMHEALRVSSPDFQTCRIADTPESAECEAALEVGLEICAAAVGQRITHNFSLSLVASCHR
jgi:hypothetical protein